MEIDFLVQETEYLEFFLKSSLDGCNTFLRLEIFAFVEDKIYRQSTGKSSRA